jgi:CRP-like cAMP-binding protein
MLSLDATEPRARRGVSLLHPTRGETRPPLRLYDEAPELFAQVPSQLVRDAAAHIRVRLRDVEPGPWPDGAAPLQDLPGGLGLLVLRGFVLRTVEFAERRSSELLGPGDVLRPWDRNGARGLLASTVEWRAVEPTVFAVLDERFLATACRHPAVLSAVVARAVRRAHAMTVQLAIADMRRVDERLLALFWHLADRWGTVRPEGIRVPLRVTHDVIAELVAAQRPTVTAALSRLDRRGALRRQPDRSWLLAGTPPHTLAAPPPPGAA